jgi:hypothetical protein
MWENAIVTFCANIPASGLAGSFCAVNSFRGYAGESLVAGFWRMDTIITICTFATYCCESG